MKVKNDSKTLYPLRGSGKGGVAAPKEKRLHSKEKSIPSKVRVTVHKINRNLTCRKRTLLGLTTGSRRYPNDNGSYAVKRPSDSVRRPCKVLPKRSMDISKHRKKDGMSLLTARIKKSIFKPRHTLVSHGRIYNVCKTCPSYHRKRLRLLKN